MAGGGNPRIPILAGAGALIVAAVIAWLIWSPGGDADSASGREAGRESSPGDGARPSERQSNSPLDTQKAFLPGPSLIFGKGLDRKTIDRILEDKGRTLERLLAAYGFTLDDAFLEELYQEHPNDQKVLLYAALRHPNEALRAEALQRLKDNPATAGMATFIGISSAAKGGIDATRAAIQEFLKCNPAELKAAFATDEFTGLLGDAGRTPLQVRLENRVERSAGSHMLSSVSFAMARLLKQIPVDESENRAETLETVRTIMELGRTMRDFSTGGLKDTLLTRRMEVQALGLLPAGGEVIGPEGETTAEMQEGAGAAYSDISGLFQRSMQLDFNALPQDRVIEYADMVDSLGEERAMQWLMEQE